MKNDWKRKLSSRKFWMAVAGFATALMIYFGASEASAERVACLIMAGGAVIAYIIGEGLADAGNAGSQFTGFPCELDQENILEEEDQ